MPFRISLPSTDSYKFRISSMKQFPSSIYSSNSSGAQCPTNFSLSSIAGRIVLLPKKRQTEVCRTCASTNRALELHSQQARGFDGKLHRQLQENLFTKTLHYHPDHVPLPKSPL